LLHASFNTNAAFFGEMFTGAGLVRMSWLLAAGWCVAAIVVVVVAGPKHLSRKHHKQEEREEGAAEPGGATPGVVKATPA
jgi:preprotein translocase subunit SecG